MDSQSQRRPDFQMKLFAFLSTPPKKSVTKGLWPKLLSLICNDEASWASVFSGWIFLGGFNSSDIKNNQFCVKKIECYQNCRSQICDI